MPTLLTSSFLKPGDGLYISVLPTASAISLLEPVIASIQASGLTYTGLPNLHVTVIYSETEVKDVDYMYRMAHIAPERKFLATVDCFEYWEGHKNQGVLVLKMKSAALTEVHLSLREDGYKVGFPDYTPHMTFIDNLHEQNFDSARSQKLVKYLNSHFGLEGRFLELTGMKAEAVS